MSPIARRALLVAGVLVLAALIALAYAVASSYEVVAKGELLPYTTGEIYQIRILGRFDLYAEPELKPSTDLFNSYILVSISTLSLFVALLLRAAAERRPRVELFFLLTWLGTGFLAADELMGLHETLGHNLRFLTALPGITRPDDAIVVFYALPALAFLLVFRDVLLSSRRATQAFVLALAIAVLSSLLDVASVPLEEPLELLASTAILVGFLLLAIEQLRANVLEPLTSGTG